MVNSNLCSNLVQYICKEPEISILMEELVTIDNLMKFQHLVAKQLHQNFKIEDFQKSASALSLYDMSDFVLNFLDISPEEYYQYSGIKQSEIDKILYDYNMTLGELINIDHLYAFHPESREKVTFTLH